MPDVRLIDANALKRLIKSGDDLIFDHATESEILHMIDYQETIDAQPVKRGEWIVPKNDDEQPYCSVCNWHAYGDLFTDYCPGCGAHMVGD